MAKVTKKITKKLPITPEVVEEMGKVTTDAVKIEEPVVEQEEKLASRVKKCPFCQNKTVPTYTDVATIKRFMSDRAKIVSRLRSGVCSKHQRILSKQIKYARHLGLLPFTPKI